MKYFIATFLTLSPLATTGNWQARGNDLSVFAGLKSTDIELAVTGEVRKERHFAAVTGEVSYVTPGSSRRTYGITGKYKNPLSGSLERHEILLSFDVSHAVPYELKDDFLLLTRVSTVLSTQTSTPN